MSTPPSIILETAMLDVRPGQEYAFEAAFSEFQTIIASITGYQSHELQHCPESSYLYQIS